MTKYISRCIYVVFQLYSSYSFKLQCNCQWRIKKPVEEGLVTYFKAKLQQLLEGPYWEKPVKGKGHPRTGHKRPEKGVEV